MPLVVEPLARRHNRRGFSCGVEKLDYFLGKTAMQHAENGISKSFVLLSDDNKTVIIGYFTLTICEVTIEQLNKADAKKLPKGHPLPAGKLARLAVSTDYQKRGYGKDLLISAMKHFILAHDQVGMSALFVDAKNDSAASFYQKYGFIQSCDDPLNLYLPTQTIKNALAQS